ncbi:hypothetical protein [Psychromonas sp. Urea-02u-13]|uniref:hypothetical protein n=1 Tax=Psychromonas sp. Urea-02u-13 TaxID=2058326 RepID=UPI000C32867E|nr:hypothetical protein [Psychromonas sp. Urea-02u-13]PKG37066.1 hypothetical protein CXF74_20850 [Psychromonas sp. Urea-02u-13]
MDSFKLRSYSYFSFILSAVFYSNSAFSLFCSGYLNKTVSPVSFSQAYKMLKVLEPKGEFETSADYKKKNSDSFIPNEILIFKKAERNDGDNFIYYNADREELGIKQFAFNNMNVGIWLASRNANPKVNIDMMSQNFSVIDRKKISSSVYSASNSFGVKVQVKETNYSVDVLVDPRKLHFLKSGLFPKYQDNEYLGALNVQPENAKLIKTSGNLAFVVKPISPYKTTSSWTFPEAKVNKPSQDNYEGNILVVNFKCGLWLNSQNKVIGAYSSE